MTNPDSIPIRLYALEADGPRELPIPAGTCDLHTLFDELPLGIYEALRTFEHDRFLGLQEHLTRAQLSIESAGLDYELDEVQLRSALHEVASTYAAKDSRIRFDVLSAAPTSLGTESCLLIAISPHEDPSAAHLEEGVRVGLNDQVRRSEPLVKSAEWVVERRPLKLDEQDEDVVILDADGRLLECTCSNFFGVRNGVIYTAPQGILQGVTRKLVMQLASDLVIPVRQVAIYREEIPDLNEAFLTGSARGILPIVNIGGEQVGDGKPGPITQQLIAGYYHLAKTEARSACPPSLK